MAEAVCAVCGNEIDPGVGQCPFCGAERAATAVSGGGPSHRDLNRANPGITLIAL